MAKPEYVSVSPTSGTGDGIVDVKLPEYSGRATRGGILTLTTAGGANKTVNISQNGEESLSVAETPKSAAAAGETVKITGTSNCAAIRVNELQQINGAAYQLSVNGTPVPDWNGRDSIQIADDPGASGSYGFELSVTVPENQTEVSRSLRFRLTNGGEAIQSDIVTIEQTAGAKTYGTPVITEFSYSGDIPASGGSLMPELAFEQTWGWNGATSGGGTVGEGGVWTFRLTSPAPEESLDTETGKVTMPSRGTEAGGRKNGPTVGAVITVNGKSSEESTCQIYQEANTLEDYSVLGISGSLEDISASGGAVSEQFAKDSGTAISYKEVYTSGATLQKQTNLFNGLDYDEIDSSISPYIMLECEDTMGKAESLPWQIDSLGTTVKNRTKLGTIEYFLLIPGTDEAYSAGTLDIYQEANVIEEFSDITIGADDNVTLSGAGEDYEINPDAHQTAIFTSGETMDENTPGTAVAFDCSYSVISPMDGFSLSGNRVAVEPNPSTLIRGGFKVFVTVKGAELEGERKSATKTITFNQSGAESDVSASPENLEFDSAGGTKQIHITSTDSWTIS